MKAQLIKRACDCSTCKHRDERDFWSIIAASYTADELGEYYDDGEAARQVMLKAAA